MASYRGYSVHFCKDRDNEVYLINRRVSNTMTQRCAHISERNLAVALRIVVNIMLGHLGQSFFRAGCCKHVSMVRMGNKCKTIKRLIGVTIFQQFEALPTC